MGEAGLPRLTSPGEGLLRAVSGHNPYEETVERLVQAIKLGVIAPGERLPPERELAAQLGVSRVTLRSAIRSLQQTGLIESRRGRSGGSFVTWDPSGQRHGDAGVLARSMGDDLVDLLAFRDALEPGTAGVAASQELTSAGRRTMAALLEACSAAEPDAYRLPDSRLHVAIAELTGSPRLVAAVAEVQVALGDILGAIPLLPEAMAHSNEQHALVVDAILVGDAARARDVMDEHVRATSSLLRGFLM